MVFTAGLNGIYVLGSPKGTKMPAMMARMIFSQSSHPSCLSAGTRVKVTKGQTSRYA
jgi:hypothetical protein